MLRKLDKLIIKSFIGPFILTTAVVVFIFLMRFLMMYFNEFVGKDLDLMVYARLFFYFSLITITTALPLAVLLASLMTYGNLGEYFELTAVKAAGIPVSRMLLPTAVIAILISIFSFFYNNIVTPWANLKGYSLLWDIKTTKLTLNIKEGIFYKELPGYRIKVQKKGLDGKSLKGITIYDHTRQNGNTSVTLADSGKMYTFYNNQFLCFELYNGTNYSDFMGSNGGNNSDDTQFLKNSFKKNKIVFSLDAFGMKRTSENQFKYHEYMKNVVELNRQIDSVNRDIAKDKDTQTKAISSLYLFYRKAKPSIDTSNKNTPQLKVNSGKWIDDKVNSIKDYRKMEIMESAIMEAGRIKSQFDTNKEIYNTKIKETYRASVEKYHKYTMAVACFVMFLIGASLGSIIKKGGFGMPVLLSITFFILMYVLMQLCDKYVKEGLLYAPIGVWLPDIILLAFGIYFLNKARNDARLFDNDIYAVYYDKFKQWMRSKFSSRVSTLVINK